MFNVGDKVRVCSDLIPYKHYNGILFTQDMAAYKGTILTIKEIDINSIIQVRENDFCWGIDMFESNLREFYKSDLQDGMVVEYKDKTKRIVLNGTLTGFDGWISLDNYDDNLNIINGDEDLDIYKVYKHNKNNHKNTLRDYFEDECLTIIYDKNVDNKIMLAALNPKDEFKIGDEIFIVLEHTDNGTRVISKEFAYEEVKFGDNSNWKESSIRKKLHDEYFNKIASIVGDINILPIHRDLTSLDGLDDYGVCTDLVSLLTADEYAKYHKILGLKINYPDWWWLITPASTPSNNYASGVCCVSSSGRIYWDECSFIYSVRPFLNLKSSTIVTQNF